MRLNIIYAMLFLIPFYCFANNNEAVLHEIDKNRYPELINIMNEVIIQGDSVGLYPNGLYTIYVEEITANDSIKFLHLNISLGRNKGIEHDLEEMKNIGFIDIANREIIVRGNDELKEGFHLTDSVKSFAYEKSLPAYDGYIFWEYIIYKGSYQKLYFQDGW